MCVCEYVCMHVREWECVDACVFESGCACARVGV